MRMFNRDWHFNLSIPAHTRKVQTIMSRHTTHTIKESITDKLLLLASIVVLPIIALILAIAPSDWLDDLQH